MSLGSRVLYTGSTITIFCALVGQWTMFYLMVILITLWAGIYFKFVRNSKDTERE